MWILSLFSDFLIHTITIIGVFGVIASFFIPSNPFTAQYGLLSKIISVAILCVGIFFEGTIYKDNVWKARVAEAEKQILIAEKKSAEANSKIQYVYITKKQNIDEIRKNAKEQIKTDADKMNAACVVVPEVVNILNKSATGTKK